VDDRTPAERRVAPPSVLEGYAGDERLAGSGLRHLRKSRYDGIDCYIGEGEDTKVYNDLPLTVDQAHVKQLARGGVDETLAYHIAHLFARDPLVIFGDRIELDDHHDVDHWENLQSTNWQTLRWKPPPPHKGELSNASEDHIGWRVEFRSMELQLTDFENAAFIAFVVLLSRVILELKLDLRVPMSKLEENMQTAQLRDACTSGRFWFRTDIDRAEQAAESKPTWSKLTIREILRGTESFVGLIPLCERYFNATNAEPPVSSCCSKYLDFIAQRAEGKLLTPAAWMRLFVLSHPSYRQDSRVPAAAVHDLLAVSAAIGEGKQRCPELFGCYEPAKCTGEDAPDGAICCHEVVPCHCRASCMQSLEEPCRVGSMKPCLLVVSQ